MLLRKEKGDEKGEISTLGLALTLLSDSSPSSTTYMLWDRGLLTSPLRASVSTSAK